MSVFFCLVGWHSSRTLLRFTQRLGFSGPKRGLHNDNLSPSHPPIVCIAGLFIGRLCLNMLKTKLHAPSSRPIHPAQRVSPLPSLLLRGVYLMSTCDRRKNAIALKHQPFKTHALFRLVCCDILQGEPMQVLSPPVPSEFGA